MRRTYARFYVLLNRLPTTDREELKANLVSQYTNGRTDSLKEMTNKEYDAMCDAMQEQDKGYKAREIAREELRRRRSAAFTFCKRMELIQQTGIALINIA